MIANPKAGVFTFYICLTLSVMAVFAISADSLLNLPSYWSKDEYSHGYLIPVIALFLGWHALSNKRGEPSTSWVGLPVLLISLVMSAFAELAAFEALLNYSFIVAIFGVFLLFFGKNLTYALTPMIVFLLFAAPLPHIVYGNLSIKMQLVSSTLGTGLIGMFGFPVYQDGNIIDLGHMKLQVEEACNGLRYLFPLMSLGYLTAYLLDDKWWKRLTLFASVIPITILMNSLRIGAIGISVNLWGQEMAEGILHAFEGYVVFGFCLVFLLGELWIILRFGKTGRFRDELISFPNGIARTSPPKLARPVLVGTMLCISAAALFYSGAIKNRLENTPVIPDLSSFPEQIGEWVGHRGYLSAAEIETLDLTDYWMADYTQTSANSPVNFYVAYYNSQRMRANIHIPLNCIIGGGWEVTSQSSTAVETPAGTVPVVRMVIEKQGQKNIVYYWLEQRGRRINSPLQAKLYLVWDSIVLHRTDGALVRVTTALKMGETQGEADERIKRFLQGAYPEVEGFIPGR
jgi:exosortase D (VPLPA-CTERM-specific)